MKMYGPLTFTFFLLISLSTASPAVYQQKEHEKVTIQKILATDLLLPTMESKIETSSDQDVDADDNFYCYECYGLMGYTSSGQMIEPVDPKCFQSRSATGYPPPTIPDNQGEGAVRLSRGKEGTGNLTTYCVTMRGRFFLNFDDPIIIKVLCDWGFCIDFIGRGKITINETEVTGSNSTVPSLLHGKCWGNQLGVFEAMKPLLDSWSPAWTNLVVNNQTWKAHGISSEDVETCYCNDKSRCNNQPHSPGYDRIYYKWVDEIDDDNNNSGNGGDI